MSLTAAAFVLFFLSGCAAALARHPIYGLMTYVAAFYIHPPSRWWGQGLLLEVRWSLLAALVTLVAIAMHGRRGEGERAFLRYPIIWGFAALICWMLLQLFWVIEPELQRELIDYYAKFLVVIYIIYRAVDSEKHLKLFLWSHVAGCFYFGWLAFTSGVGGRYEGFGGPGLGEANTAAIQVLTGVLVAASLLFSGNMKQRVVLVGAMPILVNAIVSTVSRSGFLAFAVAGVLYNVFAPKNISRAVKILSVVGIGLFLALTNPDYWKRIETIKLQGQDIEGVDTGGGRLEIIQAQWKISKSHPMGCGHMCTTTLSNRYLEDRFLFGGGRASHNTFMTMLVDHGVPGAIFYTSWVMWTVAWTLRLRRRVAGQGRFLAALLPAVAAALGAIIIGDLFVQYPKLEVRFWLIGIMLVMIRMTDATTSEASGQRLGGPDGASTARSEGLADHESGR